MGGGEKVTGGKYIVSVIISLSEFAETSMGITCGSFCTEVMTQASILLQYLSMSIILTLYL